jgi:hypothetical protein
MFTLALIPALSSGEREGVSAALGNLSVAIVVAAALVFARKRME